MRAELRRWILEIRDLGFLPEAELRTRFGRTPPHEAVRKDPGSYPLERILDAADLASRGDAKSAELLADADPAVRYWGAIGLRAAAKGGEDPLRKALEDSSVSVRIAAADALSRLGRLDEALPALARALKDENEWARHHAATVLDSLGAKADPVRDAVRAAAGDKNDYVKRVIQHALGK
jgi:HEAT repeat protein